MLRALSFIIPFNPIFSPVPPTIIDAQTSSDVTVRENSPVNLTCVATGSPEPKIKWKRADGEMIRYKGGNGEREEEMKYRRNAC